MLLSLLSLPRKYPTHPLHCESHLALQPIPMPGFSASLPTPPPDASSFVLERGARRNRVKLPPIMPRDQQTTSHNEAVFTCLPLLPSPEESSLQTSANQPASASIGSINERHDDSLLSPRLLDIIDGIEPRPFVAKPDDRISLSMAEEHLADKTNPTFARQGVDLRQSRHYPLVSSSSEDSLTSTASLGHATMNDIWDMTANNTLHRQQSLPATLRPRDVDPSTGSVKNNTPSTTYTNLCSPSGTGKASPTRKAVGEGGGTSILDLKECTECHFEPYRCKIRVPLRIRLRKASKQSRKMSLALLEPVISPDSRQEPGINDEQGRMKPSRKSSTATTVTTLTVSYTHLTLPTIYSV